VPALPAGWWAIRAFKGLFETHERFSIHFKISSNGNQRLFRPHRGRLQHQFRHSGLSRCRMGTGKRQQPVTYQAFMADEATRKRYWARSLIGWRHFGRASAQRCPSRVGSAGGDGAVRGWF